MSLTDEVRKRIIESNKIYGANATQAARELRIPRVDRKTIKRVWVEANLPYNTERGRRADGKFGGDLSEEQIDLIVRAYYDCEGDLIRAARLTERSEPTVKKYLLARGIITADL